MYTELFNPIYGTVDGLPVIALGAITASVGSVTNVMWVVTDDDGVIRSVDLTALNVDVRYRDGRWHDVSPEARDEEG